MKIFSFTLLLFLLTTATTVCRAQDCIKNLVDLERSILSNSENIQTLTRALYPVNTYPALYVEIRYHINCTGIDNRSAISTHPPACDLKEQAAVPENYIFCWASSPELIFVNLKLLEALSLHFVSIELHTADVKISPFCNHVDINAVLNILNEATSWIKSYTTNRFASVNEGVDSTLQGYTLYKDSNGDRIVLDGENFYQENVNILIAAIIFATAFGQVSVGAVIWWKHNELRDEIKQPLGDNQHFRFKNIFWAGVTIMTLGNIGILVVDIINIARNNPMSIADSRYNRFVYYLLIVGLVFTVIIDTIYAIIITVSKDPIDLPALIPLSSLNLTTTSYEIIPLISRPGYKTYLKRCLCTSCYWIFQFVPFATLMLSTAFLSVHGCGIVLAVLVNPVQVFATGTLVFLIVTFGLFWLTYVLENAEKERNNDEAIDNDQTTNGESDNCSPKIYCCCKNNYKTLIAMLAGLFFIIFLALFGRIYIEVILFAGIGSTGVVSSLSPILPAILLALTGWLVKKEYDNFTRRKNDDQEGTHARPAL